MGYSKVQAAIPVCRWFGNRRLHYARLWFVSRQEHLFPHCFGTFSISSFLSDFVLSENNLKTILTRLPEKWWMLILCNRNTSPALNCQRIQCQDYTKHNTETDTMALKGCKNYTCTTKNWVYFGLENKQNHKTHLEILMIFWRGGGGGNACSYAENLGVENTPKLYDWTGVKPPS